VIEVRLWGDPFSTAPAALALRATLLAAEAAGFACGLALTAVELRPPVGRGGPEVELDDGCGGSMRVPTTAAADELAAIVAAAGRSVVATAPLVVFGDADDCTQAGLEFAEACAVVAGEAAPAVLFARLRQLVQAAGCDLGAELQPTPALLATAAAAAARAAPAQVLVIGDDPQANGLDLALAALATLRREHPVAVTVGTSAAALSRVRAMAGQQGVEAEVVTADFRELLRAAAVVLLPWRAPLDRPLLVHALASGRVVVASRFGAAAELLRDGCCLPVGGRLGEAGFLPDPRHLVAQLRRALAEPAQAVAVGARGRALALTHARGPRPPRPAPAPAPAAHSPSLVLEAPLFELSSSSLLTLATARALLARDQVDVFVVPRGPHHTELRSLARHYPDVLARCVRQAPQRVDLWLAAGWPPRSDRPPQARSFAVRVDWEYGALPVALSPLVVQEADAVVVHSQAVAATIAAAGRRLDDIVLLPHGVDGDVFRPQAPPLADVMAFKDRRAAILFAGGLIWRKGVDVLLNALLQMPAELRARICLVVKPMGERTSYRGFELGDLVRRFQRTGAVATLIVDRPLAPSEMAGLYTACDVLAQPYRGEGFGMPVLEALACGLPAVVTAGGSTDDFTWSGSCLRVAAIQRPIELPEPCLSRPWVLEPDVRSLGAALARAVHEGDDLRRAARAAAPALAARSSWSVAAARLEELAARAQASTVQLVGVA